MWQRLRSLLRAAFARNGFEQAMREELRFHIEQYAQDLMRSGVSRDEAERRARLEFGGVNTVQSQCRQARGLRLLDESARQVRRSLRLLRKSPGFTAAALVTVAVCAGANLTIFAVVQSVLLRPLPFPQPDRLVTAFNTYPKAGVMRDGSSITNYYERRGRIPAFRSLSIYRFDNAVVGEPGATERLEVTEVSPEFFATLGVGPALGRSFREEETSPGTDTVAILSDSYWRTRLQASPRVLGRQIRVNGRPVTVVGVLPRSFRFLSSQAQLYLPFSSRPEDRLPAQRHSGGNVTQMIARLRPGVTMAKAQARIDAQNSALELDDPQAGMMADAGFRTLLVSLHADHVAAVRPTLLLLQAGALLLLLIGAVNLANLFLIRASVHRKEFALRRALGASSFQVVLETAIDTTLLTVCGGLLGLALATGGVRLLSSLGAQQLPLGTDVAFDSRLAFVALLASVILGLALAVPNAWFHLRQHLEQALRSDGRGGTAGRTAQRLRLGFTIAQIALAFVLLAGAGLLGLTLARMAAVSPGFQPEHVVSAQLSLSGAGYPSANAGLEFTERLGTELERVPGTAAAGIATNLPFSGHSGKSAAYVVGHKLRPGESPRGHYSYGVGGDYFQAMGFRLLKGRFLSAADSRSRQRLCVVDADFARYYWPHGNAVGQQLFDGSSPGPRAEAFTVAGVVGAAKQAGLDDEAAQGAVYYPYIYRPESHFFVVARTRSSEKSLALRLQKIVRHIDPQLSAYDIRPMPARITDSMAVRRSPALLAMLFSAIALLLTAVGVYGVLSYAVAQRRREIGVRMALGARPDQIRGQFLRLAWQLFAAGAALGLVGAWCMGRAMQTILFHVRAFDPLAMAGAAAIVGLVSLAACLAPAVRAARISPVEALAES